MQQPLLYLLPGTPMAIQVLGIAWVIGLFFTLRLLWQRPDRDTFNKIFWTAIVLLLPYIGMFAWFAFEYDWMKRKE